MTQQFLALANRLCIQKQIFESQETNPVSGRDLLFSCEIQSKSTYDFNVFLQRNKCICEEVSRKITFIRRGILFSRQFQTLKKMSRVF